MARIIHVNPNGDKVFAYVAEGVHIGDGVRFGSLSIIRSDVYLGDGVRIGDHAQIYDGAYLGNNAFIGDNVFIGVKAEVGASARVGNNSHIGDYAYLGNHARLGAHARMALNMHLQMDDIISAGPDLRGFEFWAYRALDGYRIAAGCRDFSPAEARAHWSDRHAEVLRTQIMDNLDYLDVEAARRGWTV